MWYAVGIYKPDRLIHVVDYMVTNKIFFDIEKISGGSASVVWVSDQTSDDDMRMLKLIEADEIGISGYPVRKVQEDLV